MCLTWLKLGFHRWRAFCKVGITLRTKGGNKEVRFWQCAGGVRGKKEGRAFNPSILMPKSQIDKLKPGTWETPSTTFDNILDLYGFVHFCLELPAPSIVFSALLNLQCCCYCFVFCACVFCFRAPFLWNQDEKKDEAKEIPAVVQHGIAQFFLYSAKWPRILCWWQSIGIGGPILPLLKTKGDWRSWITFFGCMWSSEQWFISPNGRWPLQMLWIVAGEGANNLDCKGRRAQSGSKPWCQQVEWGGHASRVCFGCSCWKMLEDAGWKSLNCGSKVAVPVAAAILRDYYEIGRHQTNIIIHIITWLHGRCYTLNIIGFRLLNNFLQHRTYFYNVWCSHVVWCSNPPSVAAEPQVSFW